MVSQVNPAIVNRFERFVGGRLHTPQATQDRPYLSHVQAGQGRFDPLLSLQRVAVLRFGHLVEVLGTMVIVEHLAGIRKQALDVFSYPLGRVHCGELEGKCPSRVPRRGH